MTALPDPADLDRIEDPIARSRAYVDAMDAAWRDYVERRRPYVEGRKRALAEAVQQHGSKKAVAERLGISPAAVGKALNAPDTTERNPE